MASLKKAFGKLKTSGIPDGSDSESTGIKTPAEPNGTASPRGSMDQPRHSHTFNFRKSGTFGRDQSRDESPRTSGTFTRHSATFPREEIAKHDREHHGSRSPVRALKGIFHGGRDSSSDNDVPLNRDGEPMSKNQLKRHQRQASVEAHRKEAHEKEEADHKRRQEMELLAEKEEPAEMKARYGNLDMNSYAGEWKHEPRATLANISKADVGKEVVFRARIHNMRRMSAKLSFIVLRQQTHTIQGVLQEHGDVVSRFFVYWAEHLSDESVVLVRGVIQEPKAKQGEVIGASIHDAEVFIREMHCEGRVSEPLPFNVHEAEVTEKEAENEEDTRIKLGDRTRLQHRIIDLRTTASQGIFRVQAGVCHFFREYLDNHGFMEIHTPKLQGGATESGASVFKVDYFGRPAFLAQSPQLAKQMCISADFGKVYEVGPVFRAENSNTHRHMTEFTGLDLEMQIDEHYHEVLRTLDGVFKHIFKGIYDNYRTEIEIIKRQFPHEDLVWLEETPVIPFREGIKLLNDSGWRDENGEKMADTEDLGTRDEIELGKLVKEKYGADYYILDKFPVAARPWYAMPDPYDPMVTNSFDIFCRGQEILSGGQRIHDCEQLWANMEKAKMDPTTVEEYMKGFAWGAPPHGGGGIGMERLLMLFLKLGDIRNGTLFHRDPKSLPAKPVVRQLRHPEASTMHPPWEGKDRAAAHLDMQPIEKLIANYGDATNTSWLEPRTQIWRAEDTGAAVGYVPADSGFVITIGDPLCHESQYQKTIQGYLNFVTKEKKWKPLWLLVGPAVEEVLSSKFNWRTFSVAAEQRVNPSHNPAEHDNDVQRKIRHAQREGVKIHDYELGTSVPKDMREKTDLRVKDWQANRKGKQVHLTDIHLWVDHEHRQYHIATQKDGTICAVVAMAQLSPDHGWQVKYSMDFPGAPSGSIEYIVTHALKYIADQGCTNATFGGGASATFTPGKNLKGTKAKILSKAYHAIATELKLTNKTEFRQKLGAEEDPIYVCYPPHGLGPMGVKAILNFFEDEEPGRKKTLRDFEKGKFGKVDIIETEAALERLRRRKRRGCFCSCL